MNPLHPNRMSAVERHDETADILAAGFVQLHARRSSCSSRDGEESSLDVLADQSSHKAVYESVERLDVDEQRRAMRGER